jgi:hypothetical protein
MFVENMYNTRTCIFVLVILLFEYHIVCYTEISLYFEDATPSDDTAAVASFPSLSSGPHPLTPDTPTLVADYDSSLPPRDTHSHKDSGNGSSGDPSKLLV